MDGEGGEAGHGEDGIELSPALLRSIIRALPVGIALRDPDGRTLLLNEAASAALDHGTQEAHSTDPARDPARGASVSKEAPARTVAPAPRPAFAERRSGQRTLRVNDQSLTHGGSDYQLSTTLDITQQRRFEDELFRRAYFDELTLLPNRSLIEQHVEDLIAKTEGTGHRLALAFIDVDNFKHINDYYGHAVGDGLLVKIAERLSSELRSTDMLARVGGDEFVLLLEPVGKAEQVRCDIDHLADRLKAPFFIDGHEIFSTASIGVSLYPVHGTSYELLRRNADSAMYRVKSGIKGGVTFFDEQMGQTATARMEVEQRLRLAIRDRRICCAYQPKVDIRSREVVGVEVLLRWRDEHGVIQAPGDFVNLAVELGLMDEITYLVLAETMRGIDRVDTLFGPNVTISINVAARQADDPRFMQGFAEALEATGRAERFMVELTEEAFIAKSRFQSKVLPMLREIGARVSIDDFGVGYSSLSALADITADELKVDRSFITDIHKRPRSQGILKAIESVSNALGMTIVVEGVETFEELAYLQAATRIKYAQGYYFSRPLYLDDPTVPGTHWSEAARARSAAREAQMRQVPNSRSDMQRISRLI